MNAGHVLCIVGPTAVGKSSVAERVCALIGGEVVSVDSMQVYRGMDIGTAKVPVAERTCPLHMVDVVDVCQPFSVAEFQRRARCCTDMLLERGLVPVLCGGTGLYLDAVIDDMRFPRGQKGRLARSRYERMAAEEGPESLWKLLKERDGASAALIHPRNVRRVIRALEMYDEGVSYANHHEGLLSRKPYYDATIWCLTMDRQVLYERIGERVDRMFEAGLVQEVSALVTQGLTEDSTAGRAIGYKEILAALQGRISMDEARDQVKRNTRRYAKRQLSWIRRDGRARTIDMGMTSAEEAAQCICANWKDQSHG